MCEFQCRSPSLVSIAALSLALFSLSSFFFDFTILSRMVHMENCINSDGLVREFQLRSCWPFLLLSQWRSVGLQVADQEVIFVGNVLIELIGLVSKN